MSSAASAKSIPSAPKDKPEFTVSYGFFGVPPHENAKAPNQSVDTIEEPNLDSKFAIERDYLDKTFNEIESEKIDDENMEASLTKIAYDERNSYVM